jgi:hypothetical protein
MWIAPEYYTVQLANLVNSYTSAQSNASRVITLVAKKSKLAQGNHRSCTGTSKAL